MLRSKTRLDPKAALPEMERLLEEGDANLRVPLANLACRLGSPAGVPTLVRAASEGKSGLGNLNALRRPEAWKRISCELPETEFGADAKSGKVLTISRRSLRGTVESIWQDLGAISGIPIVLPPRESKKGDWPSEVLEIPNDQGWTTLVDMLQESLGPYDFILEADQIRIVPRGEALKLWDKWAKEQKK